MAEFTAREMDIMTHAWNCMTEEPKVDYEKLAALCNMSNPRSASNAWRTIKQKIMAKTDGNNAAGADGVSTPTKKTPTKKRGGAKANNGADDEEGTPTKKPRSARKKKQATPESEAGEASDMETDVKKEQDGIKHEKADEDGEEFE